MSRIAILISGAHGRGSTLVNLAQACKDGRIPGSEVVGVIGTISSSPAIGRAKEISLSVSIVSPLKENYAERLLSKLNSLKPDLICLAGYMRRIPEQVLTEYRHKIVNIHPALLPSFGGQGMYGSNVHQAVFDYGVKVSGCTVHFIDSGYDTGPIILQQVVSIDDAKSPDEVGAKVLEAERIAYPEAVRLLCTGRVRVDGRRVEIEKAEEE